MSKAILRRNSSKAGLQTLLKVTAQRSIEDAEEVERERRRRARQSFRRTNSGGPLGGECSQDHGTPAEEDHDSTYDSSLKPSSSPSLEEDEGFSDWTQRREKRRQQRMQELCSQEPEEERRRQQRMQELCSQEPEEERRRQQRTQELGQEPEEEKRRQQRMQELGQEPEEEKRRQQRMQELSQEPEEEEDDNKVLLNGEQTRTSASTRGALQDKTSSTPTATSQTASTRLHRQKKEELEEEEEKKSRTSSERRKELEAEEEEAFRAEQARREKAREERTREEQRRAAKKMEELQKSPQAEVDKRKEVKVSYTSKVFLHQEAKPSHASHRDAAREDMITSCNNNKSKTPSGSRAAVQAAEPDQAEAVILETEQRLEKIRRSHQEKESQELEQLRQRQAESEQELEELKRRREERRRVREDEERRREDDDQQRLAKEEEEKRRMKGDMEKRRQEAAERMRMFSSTSTVDGDEMTLSPFSPKSPVLKKGNEEALTAESTCSITERTQSLNRSLKKSNSFKKTHPPVLLTKIDDKREQYTHAVENSQEAKAVKQGVMDIPSTPEVVSSKKNLFEGGEAWTQSPAKGTSCKDTEDLKVGVADLITQWVKGTPDGSGKQSPSCRPADVKPGDVMNKKNMWEIISDTSGKTGQRTIGTPAGKKYKFVVTGHGKYEKKPAAADENGEEYPNGKSDICQDDY